MRRERIRIKIHCCYEEVNYTLNRITEKKKSFYPKSKLLNTLLTKLKIMPARVEDSQCQV